MPGNNGFWKVELPVLWSRYEEDLIQSALDAAPCYHTVDSIKALVDSGAWDLWKMDGYGIIISAVLDMPLEKICYIMICSGTGIDVMLDRTDESIVADAKLRGCTKMVIGGRFGWLRKLKNKNYVPTGVTLERVI